MGESSLGGYQFRGPAFPDFTPPTDVAFTTPLCLLSPDQLDSVTGVLEPAGREYLKQGGSIWSQLVGDRGSVSKVGVSPAPGLTSPSLGGSLALLSVQLATTKVGCQLLSVGREAQLARLVQDYDLGDLRRVGAPVALGSTSLFRNRKEQNDAFRDAFGADQAQFLRTDSETSLFENLSGPGFSPGLAPIDESAWQGQLTDRWWDGPPNGQYAIVDRK